MLPYVHRVSQHTQNEAFLKIYLKLQNIFGFGTLFNQIHIRIFFVCRDKSTLLISEAIPITAQHLIL